VGIGFDINLGRIDEILAHTCLNFILLHK